MSQSSSSSAPACRAAPACSRSSSDNGRKRSSSSMAATSTIETEHPGELQRGLALLAVFNEGDQRDRIAAPVAVAKSAQTPVSQVDLETSRGDDRRDAG